MQTIANSDPRGYIKLTGADSLKFLQGQVTCDMETLTKDNIICGAHCSPKGRVLFLFDACFDDDNHIILETHSSVVEIALTSLKKYAVFFNTELTDISGQTVALRNRQPLSDLQRLRAGSADITAETSDLFITQMLNLDALGYISFNKGCYTGQEVVARAHYRGAVKRRMHHLRLDSTDLPTLGTHIQDTHGNSIGLIVGAAQANDNRVEVLAVLADKSSRCTQIEMDGKTFSVSHITLPYAIPTTPCSS